MRAAFLVCAALTVALLSGCGVGGDTTTVTVGADQPAAPSPARPGATPTPAAAAGGGGDAVVAEGEGSGDGNRFRFTITELKRSGPTVVLNARVVATSSQPGNKLQISSLFNDGLFNDLEGTTENEPGDVFDGVALVDPEARKKYLVARDSIGRCVCTTDLHSAFAGTDTPVSLQATLTAPPPEVKAVDVFVPSVKTFVGVPISD